MANIKVNLSKDSIDNAIQKLTTLKKKLPEVMDDAAKEIATQTKDKAEIFYGTLQYKPIGADVTFSVDKSDRGYKAVARGTSVLYEEFGTGDMGAMESHPLKSKIGGLRPYNSGSTIRSANADSEFHGISSGLYWTFKDPSGEVHYTQGIPSGKFMYYADLWAREHYKEIVKKKVDDVLSKL